MTRGTGRGPGSFGTLSLFWLSGFAEDAPDPARKRGVAEPVAEEEVDGAGDGMLDLAGDVDKAKDVRLEVVDGGATGVRALVGTGATIVGVGEFARGVDAGV